jgi:hypothetical protein
VEDQLAVKSPAEIELIRESSKWGNLAHVLLQRYTRPGLTESEVSRRASTEASLAMLDAIGPIYRAQSFFFDGASAGYRGQIGRNAAIPHALANNIVFQEGDVLVTGATAPVWGYLSSRTQDGDRGILGRAAQAVRPWSLQDTASGVEGARACCGSRRARARKHDSDYWKHLSAIARLLHEGPPRHRRRPGSSPGWFNRARPRRRPPPKRRDGVF